MLTVSGALTKCLFSIIRWPRFGCNELVYQRTDNIHYELKRGPHGITTGWHNKDVCFGLSVFSDLTFVLSNSCQTNVDAFHKFGVP